MLLELTFLGCTIHSYNIFYNDTQVHNTQFLFSHILEKNTNYLLTITGKIRASDSGT